MAYSLYKQDGEIIYGVKDFIVDTPADIATLPTDLDKIKVGSQAFVISSSERFMLNSQGAWIKVNLEMSNEDASNAANGGTLTIF